MRRARIRIFGGLRRRAKIGLYDEEIEYVKDYDTEYGRAADRNTPLGDYESLADSD